MKEAMKMDERSYDQYDQPESSSSNYGRFIIAASIIIVAAIGAYLSFLAPLDNSETYIILLGSFLIPMLCLLSFTACTWARRSSMAQTNLREDAVVFEEMRLRASRAQPMDDTDWYRCPECKEAFDISNAKIVDEKVVQCPFCESRLIIG